MGKEDVIYMAKRIAACGDRDQKYIYNERQNQGRKTRVGSGMMHLPMQETHEESAQEGRVVNLRMCQMFPMSKMFSERERGRSFERFVWCDYGRIILRKNTKKLVITIKTLVQSRCQEKFFFTTL